MATKKTDAERIEALESAVLDLQTREDFDPLLEMRSPYPLMHPEIMHLEALRRRAAGKSMGHQELEAVHRQLDKARLHHRFPERFDLARLGYIMECFDSDTTEERYNFAEVR